MQATTPFLLVCLIVFGAVGLVGLHEADDAFSRGLASFLVFIALWALILLIHTTTSGNQGMS